MPPKLKTLSGKEVIRIFTNFGFAVHSQRGSHIKLRRMGAAGQQSLTIPNHKEMDRGTLKSILRQASKFIPEDQLIPYFCSE